MLLGKRQIVLSALVVALGLAIYLNWQYANVNVATDGKLDNSGSSSSTKNYGEAELVNNNVSGSADTYFAQARVQRQQTRDEAIETIKNIFSSTSINADEIAAATTTAAAITDAMQKETEIESLIKAKGFEDCVVFLNNDKASIVVKTKGLLASEAAQIKDIVVGVANTAAGNITITEVK